MKEKWREELVCIESIAAKTHNIPGKIRGGLRSNKETRASAEMLCTTCKDLGGGLQSAVMCFVYMGRLLSS